ncbi:hypothetical protein BH23GEM6_BH23GEM6_17990 [soil metagenome]
MVNLESMVPENHRLREIDTVLVLDLSFVHEAVAAFIRREAGVRFSLRMVGGVDEEIYPSSAAAAELLFRSFPSRYERSGKSAHPVPITIRGVGNIIRRMRIRPTTANWRQREPSTSADGPSARDGADRPGSLG